MITQEEPLRKHLPDEAPLLRPRLGGLSGLALLALAVVQLAGLPTGDPSLDQVSSQLWLAAMWAGWSAAVWILVQPPLTAWRITAAALLLGWHCIIMEVARQQPIERYVIMFAGFGVWQATAAVLLQLPRWRLPRRPFSRPASNPAVLPLDRELAGGRESVADELSGAGDPRFSHEPRPGQFGILSMLVLMTVSAGVLLAVRRYGDAGGAAFLPGAALALLLLAIVAANAMAAATARRWSILWLPLMIVVAAAVAAVIAAQELPRGGAREFGDYWRIYFTIAAAFGLLLYTVGLCGRLDAAVPARR